MSISGVERHSSPCPSGLANCEDYDTMDIIRQFKNLYADKLKEIDKEGSGDCQLKLKVQERWIEDLTEQTEMMARVMKELECEATERVKMLEDKLKRSSQSACEVMKRYQTYDFTINSDDPFQKAYYLENDVRNLLEFIRRVRDDGRWSIEGLQFYEVSYCDLFGKEQSCKCSDVLPVDEGICRAEEEILPRDDSDGLERLRKEVAYLKSFGNAEETALQLKKRDEEFEALRQSMLDMRAALTEEVACKHDMISLLRKDIQQLEERCLQADKQTAFKDDIIKELRKEIKQLKHQKEKPRNSNEIADDNASPKSAEDPDPGSETLKRTIADLEKQLSDFKNQKDSAISACNALNLESSPTTHRDCQSVNNNSKLIQNKDATIQIQNATLHMTQLELQEQKKKEAELEQEIKKRQQEVEKLGLKCKELESNLVCCQERAENLQKAVDLYLNSINVLEASEEKARIEIEQLRVTVSNLQEALVSAKHELDEVRDKNQQDTQNQQHTINVLYVNLLDSEARRDSFCMELTKLTQLHKNLQDLNFELEVEHFNCLQDVAILETQLSKYQIESRANEDTKLATKAEVKKLRQQKRCYEQVVYYFKHEMAVMSEQLSNLQDILHISNQSCKEENENLIGAVTELQKLNERLQCQLGQTEQQVAFENQKNRVKEAKIDELHQIIDKKNADLTEHDAALQSLKMQLDNSLLENEHLTSTIVSQNNTILQLQCACQAYELEKSNAASRRNIKKSREDLEGGSQLAKLQSEFNAQRKLLNDARAALVANKSEQEKRALLTKQTVEDLKQQLASSEASNSAVNQECANLRNKAAQVVQKDIIRDRELSQYQEFVFEMKDALFAINQDFIETDTLGISEERKKNFAAIRENKMEHNVMEGCRWEVALYKQLVDNFKSMISQSTQQFKEMERNNNCLCERIHQQEVVMDETSRMLARKDEEIADLRLEIAENLKKRGNEVKRLTATIENLKRDKNECKSRTSELSSTQEEVAVLKNEIKKMIDNQVALNNENDKLLRQLTKLQDQIGPIEATNCSLRGRLDDHVKELRGLKETNQVLMQQNDELTGELQSLQNYCACVDRKYKALTETARSLEMELVDVRNRRDDICAESRHVVSNVRAWLDEQRKINDKVKKKVRCRCDNNFTKPKQNNEVFFGPVQTSTPCSILKDRGFGRSYGHEYQSPWSLGSQGTGSVDRESPSSFVTCSVDEWYSPNYRDDDDTDDHENANETFIKTVENFTADLRGNRMRKIKCGGECTVSKDEK